MDVGHILRLQKVGAHAHFRLSIFQGYNFTFQNLLFTERCNQMSPVGLCFHRSFLDLSRIPRFDFVAPPDDVYKAGQNFHAEADSIFF